MAGKTVLNFPEVTTLEATDYLYLVREADGILRDKKIKYENVAGSFKKFSTTSATTMTTLNQWEYVSGYTLFLEAGTWEIEGKIILSKAPPGASFATTINCGFSTENAVGVTANISDSIFASVYTGDGVGKQVTAICKAIVTNALDFDIYFKTFHNQQANSTSLTVTPSNLTSWIIAKRLF